VQPRPVFYWNGISLYLFPPPHLPVLVLPLVTTQVAGITGMSHLHWLNSLSLVEVALVIFLCCVCFGKLYFSRNLSILFRWSFVFWFVVILFIYLAVVGFELRALHFLGFLYRCSTTWATPSALFLWWDFLRYISWTVCLVLTSNCHCSDLCLLSS
jgi:hypothetical protein